MIEEAFSQKEYALLAFLNIEWALNNVFLNTITSAIMTLGVDDYLVGLIDQLLT